MKTRAVEAVSRPTFSPAAGTLSGVFDGSYCIGCGACAALDSSISMGFEPPLLLVPHVGSPIPDEDDYAFMDSLAAMVAPQVEVPVRVAPAGLSAAELKWLIGQCAVFAGARTHSTIAALSSGVPTLSLSYSVKAIGINQDIFGHQEFCKPVKTIGVEDFAGTIAHMIENEAAIRTDLATRLPEVRARARSAGPLLARIIEARPA